MFLKPVTFSEKLKGQIFNRKSQSWDYLRISTEFPTKVNFEKNNNIQVFVLEHFYIFFDIIKLPFGLVFFPEVIFLFDILKEYMHSFFDVKMQAGTFFRRQMKNG